ncbi:transcriptional regulator [Nonomuraea sp. NN258]|nr:transcriptional regulator [Nonomuraea antri]
MHVNAHGASFEILAVGTCQGPTSRTHATGHDKMWPASRASHPGTVPGRQAPKPLPHITRHAALFQRPAQASRVTIRTARWPDGEPSRRRSDGGRGHPGRIDEGLASWPDFGRQLRLWRRQAGFAQLQVGQRVGYDHGAISKVEVGARQPSFQLVRQLDGLLAADGVSPGRPRHSTSPFMDVPRWPSWLPDQGRQCTPHGGQRCAVPSVSDSQVIYGGSATRPVPKRTVTRSMCSPPCSKCCCGPARSTAPPRSSRWWRTHCTRWRGRRCHWPDAHLEQAGSSRQPSPPADLATPIPAHVPRGLGERDVGVRFRSSTPRAGSRRAS